MDKVDVRIPKERKAAIAPPKNAQERAVALIDVAARLTALIERETGILNGRHASSELGRLADEKRPLSIAYDELSRLLRIDRQGMAALPTELKERLSAAGQELATLCATNAERLRGAAEAQQVVVDALVAGINRLRNQQPGVAYGPVASSVSPLRGYGAPTRGHATSATLNACF